jgi:LuxR family maltose regulon positive regulatory protein
VSFEKRWPDEDQSPLEPLSQRELQVLRLIAHGASTREIEQQLVIASSTIKTYLKSIYRKLDVHTRVQAVVRAAELNIL